MESGDSEIEGSDTNSVRDGFHPSVLLHRESFARLIQWICVGQNCDLGKVKLMFLKFCVKYWGIENVVVGIKFKFFMLRD